MAHWQSRSTKASGWHGDDWDGHGATQWHLGDEDWYEDDNKDDFDSLCAQAEQKFYAEDGDEDWNGEPPAKRQRTIPARPSKAPSVSAAPMTPPQRPTLRPTAKPSRAPSKAQPAARGRSQDWEGWSHKASEDDHSQNWESGHRWAEEANHAKSKYSKNLNYNTEEVVEVPKKYISKLIGKKAERIIAIQKDTGVYKIDARNQTTDPVQVRVIGKKHAVDKAKAVIADLIFDTATALDSAPYVEVPQRKIPMLIGEKGARIRELQETHGVKIDIGGYEDDPVKVYVRGPREQVEQAKIELGRITLTTVEGQVEAGSQYLKMPEVARGVILGTGGKRLRDLQKKTDTRIDLDKKDGLCMVRISADTPGQVEDAVQEIFALIVQEFPKIADKIEHVVE